VDNTVSPSERNLISHVSSLQHHVAPTISPDDEGKKEPSRTRDSSESDYFGVPMDADYLDWNSFSKFVVGDEKEKESVFKRGDV
jgi:hypothetical protein